MDSKEAIKDILCNYKWKNVSLEDTIRLIEHSFQQNIHIPQDLTQHKRILDTFHLSIDKYYFLRNSLPDGVTLKVRLDSVDLMSKDILFDLLDNTNSIVLGKINVDGFSFDMGHWEVYEE